MMNGLARIELLQSRLAIADVVHGYALNIRTGNGADCARFFTEDAVFEVRQAIPGSRGVSQMRSRLEGRDAILSYLSHGDASQTSVCPLIHNLIIQVQGCEATSNCAMTAIVWQTGQQIVGEYHDRFRFEDGWRFSSRIYTILGQFGPAREVGSR